MSYYCFNKCTEDNLPQIEQLVESLGVIDKLEYRGNDPCSKGIVNICWDFTPFQDKDIRANITYTVPHNNGYLLVLQTTPLDHNNQEVMDLVKKLISICQPTKICDGTMVEYDMSLFE